MSEEEKKALEITKTIIEFAGDSYIPKENRKALQTLLNLIEKQQKEIEELNEIKQQICNEELITQDYVQDNFIEKDKIREKIKYYKEKREIDRDNHIFYDCYIAELEELLEEKYE